MFYKYTILVPLLLASEPSGFNALRTQRHSRRYVSVGFGIDSSVDTYDIIIKS